MAPLPDAILALIPRSLGFSTAADGIRSPSPMAAQHSHLVKRAGHADYSAGTKPPNAFDNKGFQALFALIGVGMVLTSIWFFFWAKNGGFKFQEGDWEDYKSTVLRRKGPDGKTLSNATKSTKLGGGSVVHGGGYSVAESSIGYTDETGTTADFGEMREVEEGKGRRAFGLRGGEGEKKKKRSRRDHDSNHKDEDLREYRGEKAARVGGLNRPADGVYTDYSNTEPSELGSNLSSRPLVDPKDKKKEAKEKERRAKERMRKAKLIEKNAARTAAAEAKAQKEAEKALVKTEKALVKREKAEKKHEKKTKRTETEYTPSEAPASEYPRSEAPASEYPAAKTEQTKPEAPRTEYTVSEGTRSDYSRSEAPRSEYPRLNGSRPPPSKSTRKSYRAPPSAAYSFVSGDDTNTVYTGTYTDNPSAPSEAAESSYYSDYRPNADPAAFSRATRSRHERRSHSQSRSQSQSQSQSQARSNSSSPRKQHRSSRQQEAPSDIFTQTNGPAQGNMSYPCYIPGLSSAGSVGVSESISQVAGPTSNNRRSARGGGRDVMDGYRRGGIRPVGRRDSLSDSDS